MGDYLFFRHPVRYREVAAEISKKEFYRHFTKVVGNIYLRNDLLSDRHNLSLALLKRYPDGVLRGFAALRYRGYELLDENWKPIITVVSQDSKPKNDLVKVIRRKNPDELQKVKGYSLVTDAQALVDIVSMPETAMKFEEQVALLDHLLRQNPYLRTELGKHECLKELLEYSNIFAESRPESIVRVRLQKAGMGTFVTQFRVEYQERRYFLDLADPYSFVGIEYQGIWHFNSKQRADDIDRKNDLADAGWTVFEISAETLHDKKRFADICQRIKNIRKARMAERQRRLPLSRPLNGDEF
ncbi:hypothetical protein [Corynebacterium callunae]|uniref:hypothetical protein n=1 Tax=Corynebacterium callunae TaxID=1721 RepID=UPI001FFE7EC6|nr:hypothetical protein [Corynebacterium callunae]MCK2199777.1 hypothetical protein [Corynebacterium callunae]